MLNYVRIRKNSNSIEFEFMISLFVIGFGENVLDSINESTFDNGENVMDSNESTFGNKGKCCLRFNKFEKSNIFQTVVVTGNFV